MLGSNVGVKLHPLVFINAIFRNMALMGYEILGEKNFLRKIFGFFVCAFGEEPPHLIYVLGFLMLVFSAFREFWLEKSPPLWFGFGFIEVLVF